MIVHSQSEKETLRLAKAFGKTLKGGEIVALEGTLGSGKTVFTRGIARALNVKEKIISPTFVLFRIYKTHVPRIRFFCHIDTYRLRGGKELEAIGALEWIGRPDTVSMIEWPTKIKRMLKGKVYWIKFRHGKKEHERVIDIPSFFYLQ